MKGKIWNLFEKEVLVLCGDGRMDSPGFSAKYCLYVMMDHFLDLIVDVEVVDKREAGTLLHSWKRWAARGSLREWWEF